MAIHPHVALYDDPKMWDIVNEVRAGLAELTREDWDNLSSFEFEIKAAMVAALRRGAHGS